MTIQADSSNSDQGGKGGEGFIDVPQLFIVETNFREHLPQYQCEFFGAKNRTQIVLVARRLGLGQGKPSRGAVPLSGYSAENEGAAQKEVRTRFALVKLFGIYLRRMPLPGSASSLLPAIAGADQQQAMLGQWGGILIGHG